MRHHLLPIGILAITCGLLANAAPARAAAQTWVSGTGTNAGNCPITAPCKTFQYAHNKTNADGVLNVLSAGSFGPLTITKPISIVADGVEAVIPRAGSNGAAILIQAGASDVVSLRGLTIDVAGNNGISFVSGAALHVRNCVIRRTTTGINFVPASGTSELHVADSAIADASSNGISVLPTGSGGAKVVIERVRVENAAGSGILFTGQATGGSITATVRDSVSAGNGSVGIRADEGGGGTTEVTVDRSAAVNNDTGIGANGAGARIHIGDSTVSGNVSAALLTVAGGAINSYQTNKMTGIGVPTNIIPMR